MADPNIRIKRSSVPGKVPTEFQLPLGELALNTYDAELFARRERAGIGTDIVRLGAGAARQPPGRASCRAARSPHRLPPPGCQRRGPAGGSALQALADRSGALPPGGWP